MIMKKIGRACCMVLALSMMLCMMSLSTYANDDIAEGSLAVQQSEERYAVTTYNADGSYVVSTYNADGPYVVSTYDSNGEFSGAVAYINYFSSDPTLNTAEAENTANEPSPRQPIATYVARETTASPCGYTH